MKWGILVKDLINIIYTKLQIIRICSLVCKDFFEFRKSKQELRLATDFPWKKLEWVIFVEDHIYTICDM
jgi:hypothetical protein